MKQKLNYLFAILVLLTAACQKDDNFVKQSPEVRASEIIYDGANHFIGEIPPATVELKDYPRKIELRAEGVNTLTPDLIEATLKPTEAVNETVLANLFGGAAQGDVLFCFDLTGSMGGELSNIKANSINVMNAVQAVIPDVQFGLISHADYPGPYAACGYSDTYGTATDFPYVLNQSITSTFGLVTSSINDLVLASGYDMPESYSRALYESYADENIGWRDGSKKIVVAWLDDIPHDCSLNTGTDPGRDGIIGTADDLAIADVLAEMANQNITLLTLASGNLTLWEGYSAVTGGNAFTVNSDGTLPGGLDLGDFIADIIEAEISAIDKLELAVLDPTYQAWFTDVAPASYIDIVLNSPQDFSFDTEFTVPGGTPSGVYSFDVSLLGDGAVLAISTVEITVVTAIEIPFDIKPQGCVNPLNSNAGGVIPCAILGTADFNVNDIDPLTVQLEGVSAESHKIKKSGSPYYPFVDRPLDQSACTNNGSDNYKDLSLKFDNQDVFDSIGSITPGDHIRLIVTGELYDGTEFVGEDIVRVVN